MHATPCLRIHRTMAHRSLWHLHVAALRVRCACARALSGNGKWGFRCWPGGPWVCSPPAVQRAASASLIWPCSGRPSEWQRGRLQCLCSAQYITMPQPTMHMAPGSTETTMLWACRAFASGMSARNGIEAWVSRQILMSDCVDVDVCGIGGVCFPN